MEWMTTINITIAPKKWDWIKPRCCRAFCEPNLENFIWKMIYLERQTELDPVEVSTRIRLEMTTV